jgi:hypothetical protein
VQQAAHVAQLHSPLHELSSNLRTAAKEKSQAMQAEYEDQQASFTLFDCDEESSLVHAVLPKTLVTHIAPHHTTSDVA